MAPTMITQLVLLAFGVGVIGFTISLYFGDWETRYPRRFVQVDEAADIECAVRRMRREIEEYERGNAA